MDSELKTLFAAATSTYMSGGIAREKIRSHCLDTRLGLVLEGRATTPNFIKGDVLWV